MSLPNSYNIQYITLLKICMPDLPVYPIDKEYPFKITDYILNHKNLGNLKSNLTNI